MAEVHSLFGSTTLTADGVNPEVVKLLKDLLAEAERGEIIAFSAAYLDGAAVANSAVAGSSGRTTALGGAIGMLQHRYYQQWRESTDQEAGS